MVQPVKGSAVTAFPLLQLPNTYRAFYGAFAALRPFQREVIQPILQGQDLILQAATGSGKTEAVLAPCLERVIVLIIDEVHQFIQGYRGHHLAYLLQRLEQRRRRWLQKIALSATLAGPE